jgi:hypothetical protein
VAQGVSRWSLTSEAQVRVRVSACGVRGRQTDSETGFSLSSSVFPVNINPPELHTRISSGGRTIDRWVAAF